jgi:hypothetical protein
MLTRCRASFDRARRRIEQERQFTDGWICKTGVWPCDAAPKSVVLKLLKTRWSSDDQSIGNSSGIFFSVWTDEIRPGRLRYNIHALKLRELRGFALQSRKFAHSFRDAFAPISAGWPNVSMDFGPQTLMQGFQETSVDAFEDRVVEWSIRFFPVSALIDELLVRAEKAG